MTITDCPFCGCNEHRDTVFAKEMMYGTQEKFRYFGCAECHSYWMAEGIDSESMKKHYPESYYSFSTENSSKIKQIILAVTDRWFRRWPNPIGRILAERWPNAALDMLAKIRVSRNARIADVGCGGGELLMRLRRAGFRHLLGVDPFVEADLQREGGVRVRKAFLNEIEGQFDLIMFNHSLEHVADPVADLVSARKLLATGGRILVRVPSVSSEAWDEYGTDWFQFDAPRHLALPSRAGMAAAAARAGLKVSAEFQDSNAKQFWISEHYRQGIPLAEAVLHPPVGDDLARYQARAAAANTAGRGDQAGFLLEVSV